MLQSIFNKKCILQSKTFVLLQWIQLTFVCRFSWLRLLKTKPILSWRASGGAVILSSFSVATNSVSIFVALAIDGWKTCKKMTTCFWQNTCLQINTSWNAHLRFLSGAVNFNINQRKIITGGNLTHIITDRWWRQQHTFIPAVLNVWSKDQIITVFLLQLEDKNTVQNDL